MRSLVLALALLALVPATAAAGVAGSETLSSGDPASPDVDATHGAAVVDASGTVTVVYQQGTGTSSQDQIVVRRRPPGGPFGPPVALSAAGGDARLPDLSSIPPIGIDAAGNVTVAYVERIGADRTIWIRAAPPGGDFGAPLLAIGPTSTAIGVDGLLVAPDGTLAVLASMGAGGELAARTKLPGQPFSPLASIDALTSGNAHSGGVDANGRMTVVYRAGFPGKLFVATASPAGSFTYRTALPTPTATDSATVVEPDGRTVVVYPETDGTLHQLVRPAIGAFGPPTALGVSASGAPRLFAAPDGTASLLYGVPGGGVALRTNATGAFGAAEPVVGDGYPAGIAGAVDPSGQRVVLVDRSVAGGYEVAAASAPPGGAFGPPQAVRPVTTASSSDVAATAVAPGVVLLLSSVPPKGASSASLVAAFADAAPPDVRAVSVPGAAVAGTAATLSVDASDYVSGTALGVHWDFGDGTAADGASVAHAWASAGARTVTVTVTDAAGNAATRTAPVAVAAAPVTPVDPPKQDLAPHSTVKAVAKAKARAGRALTLAGTARAARGVRRVEVTVQRKAGGRCRWMTAKGTVAVRKRTCRTVWLPARGTTAWTLTLRRGLPKGAWTVRSRATDRTGARETAWSARAGNQRAVTIR
jgi:hypothetical protein